MKKKILHLCFSLLFTALLIEFGCFLLLKFNYLSANTPDYKYELTPEPFWADINPYFGVWHNRKEYRHLKDCFDVTYRTNSVGAIDKERALESNKPRVIVLGDSFMEGYGVETKHRLSDLLELETGIEFLNFGTAGNFSPTQYYLIYKHLAKAYSHDFVMIAILPANDFMEDDYANSETLFADRYRPYWTGEYPLYHLKYFNERLNQSSWSIAYFNERKRNDKVKLTEALRSFTYTYNIYEYFRSLMVYRKFRKPLVDPLESDLFSGYYDYSTSQWNRLKYSLEKIVEEASGKKLIVLTIPTLNDIRRFSKHKQSPLHSELNEFCQKQKIKYVDLLPIFYENYSPWVDLYMKCDGHWSIKGHEAAKDILLNGDLFSP